MKVALMSDVHLEFGDLPIEPVDAEVLILAGDIFVVKDLQIDNDRKDRIMNFMSNACSMFKHVVLICGNHEHYHGDFATSYTVIREAFKEHTNLHILDNDIVDIDGYMFVGGTLWTDMNKEDPSTLYGIKGYMNDYRIIQNSNEVVNFKTPVYGTKEGGGTDYDTIVSQEFHTRPAKFSPETSVVAHKKMLEVVKRITDNGSTSKVIVVGHHSPSKLSTKPQYEDDTMVNGAYSSDLSEFILDRPQIKLWVHGHTHHEFDYMIGGTRIVCNPRGYVDYERGNHRDEPYFAKVIEV